MALADREVPFRTELEAVTARLDAGAGDLLLIVADSPSVTAQVLGALRARAGQAV